MSKFIAGNSTNYRGTATKKVTKFSGNFARQFKLCGNLR